MNPLIGIRALAGLALPVALAISAREQRRARRARDADRPRIERPDPATGLQPSPGRRRLRSLATCGADLRGFDLRGAQLDRLNRPALDLSGADLTGAHFRRSLLEGARFRQAALDYVDFSGCDLRGADLSGSSLLETDFSGADLRGANLAACRRASMVHLRGALFDHATAWPHGLDPRAAGAVLVPN